MDGQTGRQTKLLYHGRISVFNDIFVQLCSCCFSLYYVTSTFFERVMTNEWMNEKIVLWKNIDALIFDQLIDWSITDPAGDPSLHVTVLLRMKCRTSRFLSESRRWLVEGRLDKAAVSTVSWRGSARLIRWIYLATSSGVTPSFSSSSTLVRRTSSSWERAWYHRRRTDIGDGRALAVRTTNTLSRTSDASVEHAIIDKRRGSKRHWCSQRS